MEGNSNTVMEVSATKQNNGSVPQDSQNGFMHYANKMDDDTFHVRGLFDGKAKVQNGSEEVEVSITDKQNTGSVPQDSENEFMHCANNMDDDTFHMRGLFDGKTKVQNGSEDVEVNITDCTVSSDLALVEAECQDTTENSSSFDNSVSETRNASTLSDVEVESPFCGSNSFASVFEGYNGALPMRKKKLTDHWRRFVRPIMWRCKWIELQIKEFQSQALKYDREIADYDQKKRVEYEKLALEGIDARSRPFSRHIQRNQVMKRKKRKRVEDTTDLASYMSQHNLFSYFDNKIVNGKHEFEFDDGWLSLEFKGVDKSLAQILSKIEVVQSQVRQLKSRIDKVVSENPGKFCSVNRLSLFVPCDALACSDQNAASPENGNGRRDRSLYISSQHRSECNMGDLFVPGSSGASHEEVIPLPDTIRRRGQPQIGGSCEHNKELILMDDQAYHEDLQLNFERVISRFTENPQVPARNLNSGPPVMAPEAELPIETSVPHGQPSSSRSNVRNNKRKQGRRKSRTGKWSRRSSG
ncbi:uncharacterized protein LOC116136381 isoform X2 [Pistacia vera]|uniref:uncharacterized protein LOC116136381 isoform X2 n=1 Tax=Pistacia vera TaxID=55513 RepID=UPI001262C9DC|nr:uncharacterized protein LOC116136381 isoform X2 [Pistacia vera]